jgi:hypothetical protein
MPSILFGQQAEAQIKSGMGIGSHISEPQLIDELNRMGMNESIVGTCHILSLKQ